MKSTANQATVPNSVDYATFSKQLIATLFSLCSYVSMVLGQRTSLHTSDPLRDTVSRDILDSANLNHEMGVEARPCVGASQGRRSWFWQEGLHYGECECDVL